MYPISASLTNQSSSGVSGHTGAESGGITFGSFAVGSGANAATTPGAGLDWKTLGIVGGVVLAVVLLIRRVW